jgi:hypothetical protein
MNYEYKTDGKLGIVSLSGTKAFQDAKDAWQEMRAAVERDSLSAILVLDNSVSLLHAFEVIEVESWIRELGFPSNDRFAIVDPRPASLTNNNWFGETVAHNRGQGNIRVFRDEDSARQWLSDTAAAKDAPGRVGR